MSSLSLFIFCVFFCLARGHVEDWLGKVEEAMIINLRKITKSALVNFFKPSREEWCVAYPSQVTISCLSIGKVFLGLFIVF